MREMKCDNKAVWNEFLSLQHQKEGRKEGRKKEASKQEVTFEIAYLKVHNERKCVLHVECQKYRKKQKHDRP